MVVSVLDYNEGEKAQMPTQLLKSLDDLRPVSRSQSSPLNGVGVKV